jgi:glucosamine--fructose-6-phosphate aminotransferase (isomerizing)
MISKMEEEALSAPAVLTKQFVNNHELISDLCSRLHCQPPAFVMTIARGSSDHAATFAKYLFETRLGWVTASAAPSTVTLYDADLSLKNSLVIALSQSGESPDVAEMVAIARRKGAITVAIVNHETSPVAQAAEYVIPLCAGPEVAVAATKSYIATLGVLVYLTALLAEDKTMLSAVEKLPAVLQQASKMDWSACLAAYMNCSSTFVVGRGYGFPIAQEAALKFKETAQIHAEAFSGAEVLHGPFALIQQHFPLLMFGQQDVALNGMLELAKRAEMLGANVFLAVPPLASHRERTYDGKFIILPLPEALHPVCDPLVVIQAFYMMMAKLAKARGFNPDISANLTKVTKTW